MNAGLVNIDIGKVTDIVGGIIDRLWPNKTAEQQQQAAQEIELLKGQLTVNAVEAANTSLFIAGWRPFVGWVCGSALAWQFVAGPFLVWALLACGITTALPALDITALITILTTMLGMGALRTVEKYTGTEGNR